MQKIVYISRGNTQIFIWGPNLTVDSDTLYNQNKIILQVSITCEEKDI